MASGRSDLRDGDHEDLPEGGNVLLLAPSVGGAERDACAELLVPASTVPFRAVHVLYVEAPAERVGFLERRAGRRPERTAVVRVGVGGGVDGPGSRSPADGYDVVTVADPADVTGLGMVLTSALGQLHGDGHALSLCFDSLSILLQYADLDRVFRFLHDLTGMLGKLDAHAHFHLDPAAHDRRTIARIGGVVDSVVEVGEDGSRSVRR